MDDSFTVKQRAFILEYPKDWNATRAAKRAGYASSSAAVRGSELVRNRKVMAAVKAEVDTWRQRYVVTKETQLARLYRVLDDPDCPHAVQVSAIKHVSELYGLTREAMEEAAEGIVDVVKRLAEREADAAG